MILLLIFFCFCVCVHVCLLLYTDITRHIDCHQLCAVTISSSRAFFVQCYIYFVCISVGRIVSPCSFFSVLALFLCVNIKKPCVFSGEWWNHTASIKRSSIFADFKTWWLCCWFVCKNRCKKNYYEANIILQCIYVTFFSVYLWCYDGFIVRWLIVGIVTIHVYICNKLWSI